MLGKIIEFFATNRQKQKAADTMSFDTLASMFEKDEHHDLEFKCKDGGLVSCNRAVILAKYGGFFDAQLTGKFKEKNESVVSILEFDKDVIDIIVANAYSLDVTLLMPRKRKWGDNDMDFVVFLLEILRACDFFDIDDLAKNIAEQLKKQMQSQPLNASLVVLEKAYQMSISSDTVNYKKFSDEALPNCKVVANLATLAMDNLRSSIDLYERSPVTKEALRLVSPKVLSFILLDEDIAMNDYELFKLLRMWKDVNEEIKEDDMGKLVECLRLTKIDPELLESELLTTSWVPKDLVHSAFRYQATSLCKSTRFSFLERRSGWTKQIGERIPRFIRISNSASLFDGVYTLDEHGSYVKDRVVVIGGFKRQLMIRKHSNPREWTIGSQNLEINFFTSEMECTLRQHEQIPSRYSKWVEPKRTNIIRTVSCPWNIPELDYWL